MAMTYMIHSTTTTIENILEWIAKTTLEWTVSSASSGRRFLKLIRANL
jgi:hypothetical protein